MIPDNIMMNEKRMVAYLLISIWLKRGGIEATYVDDEFVMYVDNNVSESGCPTNHKVRMPHRIKSELRFTKIFYEVYIKPTQTWYERGEFMANLLFHGQAGSTVTNVTVIVDMRIFFLNNYNRLM